MRNSAPEHAFIRPSQTAFNQCSRATQAVKAAKHQALEHALKECGIEADPVCFAPLGVRLTRAGLMVGRVCLSGYGLTADGRLFLKEVARATPRCARARSSRRI